MTTVRDAGTAVLRRLGARRLHANPGSTEIPLLVGADTGLEFVLSLHEASVVGAATGEALGSGRPAVALLHTTAGLGNAVGALATARANRAPLVVLVGQQDRRHLAAEPFLAGRLAGLAGEAVLGAEDVPRAQDVPAALARAWHRAAAGRGPVLVVVPMDDWEQEAQPADLDAAALVVRDGAGADPAALRPVAEALAAARRPALVVGAGSDSPRAWAALEAVAERCGALVHQEAFSARAGFRQDHPAFAGFLPAARDGLRAVLGAHDVVVVVGAAAFRQYHYAPGPFAPEGTRVLVVTDDPAEARRSTCELAVVAPLPAAAEALADALADALAGAPAAPPAPRAAPAVPAAPVEPVQPGGPLHHVDVLAALARRLPADAVLVEEAPTARPDLHRLLPARRPLGFVSAAMGGLGFALPAAVGLRMALPERPVVAVVGDGSSLYAVQALWTAAHYRVGIVAVVLANGRYGVMDSLAGAAGGRGPWPAFEEVSVSALARGLGCPAVRAGTAAELERVLDEVAADWHRPSGPLLVEVAVAHGAPAR